MAKKTKKADEPVDEQPAVVAEPEKPNGSSRLAGVFDNPNRPSAWLSAPLIESHEIRFKNPMGHNVAVRAELRRQGDRGGLRCIVGRNDDRSPTGLGRLFFYEDIPHIVEALVGVYVKGAEAYVGMERERLEKLFASEIARIEDTISKNPDDWRRPLLEVKQRMSSMLSGGSPVADGQGSGE